MGGVGGGAEGLNHTQLSTGLKSMIPNLSAKPPTQVDPHLTRTNTPPPPQSRPLPAKVLKCEKALKFKRVNQTSRKDQRFSTNDFSHNRHFVRKTVGPS